MASGDTLAILPILANEPPTANYATMDTRNNHNVLDFDGGTNESAIFSAVMPRNYASGGVTVYVHFAMTTASTGDIDWEASFERIGTTQDLDADSFAAVQSVLNTTVPGTVGVVGVVAITFTDGAQMDSVAVGEAFRLKITRGATADTAAGDAELLSVEIKET